MEMSGCFLLRQYESSIPLIDALRSQAACQMISLRPGRQAESDEHAPEERKHKHHQRSISPEGQWHPQRMQASLVVNEDRSPVLSASLPHPKALDSELRINI